jgi:glycosyltransferase involved in cell wall biosynthesis
LLLPPDDVDAWSGALWRVLTDTELAARLRQVGPERARQFTWRKTAEATLAVYRAA